MSGPRIRIENVLRDYAEMNPGTPWRSRCEKEAADAIESLRAENARLTEERDALVVALGKIAPIRVHNGPDYAEVYFADGQNHSTQAMTMNPQDWLDIDAALAKVKGAPDAR